MKIQVELEVQSVNNPGSQWRLREGWRMLASMILKQIQDEQADPEREPLEDIQALSLEI